MTGRILLFQLDGKIPNLALMRLAAHHRRRGQEVQLVRTGQPERTLWDSAEPPRAVYGSALFLKSRPTAERLIAAYRKSNGLFSAERAARISMSVADATIQNHEGISKGENSGMQLALIIPLEMGGVPTPPIYNPPGIWPGPGFPAHPIAPGGPPPGVWPGPGYPAHPIAPGGPPPGVWPGPGVPTPPIYYPPVGVWPPPGSPAHPIVIPPDLPVGIWPGPGRPEHPIVLPPAPPGIWPPPAKPEHPIVLPPEQISPPLTPGFPSEGRWVLIYIPGIGYEWVYLEFGPQKK